MAGDRGTGDEAAERARELGALRRRIDRWRGARTTRAMPEALWSDAVELAGRYGAYAVSRALGVSYGTVRARMEAAADASPAFVELPVGLGGAASESVVELSRDDGARMTIRVAHGLDVAALSAAFLERRR